MRTVAKSYEFVTEILKCDLSNTRFLTSAFIQVALIILLIMVPLSEFLCDDPVEDQLSLSNEPMNPFPGWIPRFL